GLGDRAAARRGRHHRAAHHPVPRRGGPARAPHLRDRPRQGHRPGHARRAQVLRRYRGAVPARRGSGRPCGGRRRRRACPRHPRRARGGRRLARGESAGRRRRSPACRCAAARAARGGRAGRRVLTGPAEPRRGVPRPHGPARRAHRGCRRVRAGRGGGRMSSQHHPVTDAVSASSEVNPLVQALSLEARPHRPGPLATSLAFAWRALLKIKHVPDQLFDVTLTPIIFTLMFTYLFGGAIAGSTEQYLQFLLPGILVQTVILTTVYTGFTLNTDISKGVFDRFRSLPIWRPSPLVGALLGDAVRYAVASTVVVVLGLVLGFRPDGGVIGVVGAVVILLVFASGIGWIFTTLGLILRTPNAVMGVGMMIIMPFTFASNIFVDPST